MNSLVPFLPVLQGQIGLRDALSRTKTQIFFGRMLTIHGGTHNNQDLILCAKVGV